MRFLVFFTWFSLLTAQLSGTAMAGEMHAQASPEKPLTIDNHSGPLSDFFLLPDSVLVSASAPLVKEPFFKWKSFLPERSVDTFIATQLYPESIQDICRCPTVAIVLFPYHEFL